MRKEVLEQKVGPMTDEQYNLFEKLLDEDITRQNKINLTAFEFEQLCIDVVGVVRRLN